MKHLAYVIPILLFLPLLGLSQENPGPDIQARILSTQELTNQADVVALGKVTALKSEWNEDKSRIYTRARIDVHEFLKGNTSDQSMTVVTLGGEVGDVGEIYSGTVFFRTNEEVVVFARKREGRDHEFVVRGEGNIPVHVDKGTGARTVLRGTRLEDFCSQVRTAVQAVRPEEVKQ